jgi:hypothetical protein
MTSAVQKPNPSGRVASRLWHHTRWAMTLYIVVLWAAGSYMFRDDRLLAMTALVALVTVNDIRVGGHASRTVARVSDVTWFRRLGTLVYIGAWLTGGVSIFLAVLAGIDGDGFASQGGQIGIGIMLAIVGAAFISLGHLVRSLFSGR